MFGFEQNITCNENRIAEQAVFWGVQWRASRTKHKGERDDRQPGRIFNTCFDAGSGMSASANQRASRWLGAIGRGFGWFDQGLDWFERSVLVAGIGGMAAVTVANVLLRNIAGSSLQFADDVSQILLVVVTFMGIGIAARHARHIRVSAIHDLLPEKAQKALLVFVSLSTAALLFLMAGYGWAYAESTRRSCRILPEALAAVPLWAGIIAVVVTLVVSGQIIRLAIEGGERFLASAGPWKRRVALIAATVILLAAGWLLLELFMHLVNNRSGRCRVTASTGFPVYLVHMTVPLGFFLGGIQFFLAAVRNLTRRENYLSWYRRDEYESEEQAARQSSLSQADIDG